MGAPPRLAKRCGASRQGATGSRAKLRKRDSRVRRNSQHEAHAVAEHPGSCGSGSELVTIPRLATPPPPRDRVGACSLAVLLVV
jgi:hypothetical protein